MKKKLSRELLAVLISFGILGFGIRQDTAEVYNFISECSAEENITQIQDKNQQK